MSQWCPLCHGASAERQVLCWALGTEQHAASSLPWGSLAAEVNNKQKLRLELRAGRKLNSQEWDRPRWIEQEGSLGRGGPRAQTRAPSGTPAMRLSPLPKCPPPAALCQAPTHGLAWQGGTSPGGEQGPGASPALGHPSSSSFQSVLPTRKCPLCAGQGAGVLPTQSGKHSYPLGM